MFIRNQVAFQGKQENNGKHSSLQSSSDKWNEDGEKEQVGRIQGWSQPNQLLPANIHAKSRSNSQKITMIII